MKIAMCYFPLEKVGGIITAKTNLINGFKSLGHEVDEFFISCNTTRLPEKNDFEVAKILGFERAEWFEEYKGLMEQYDLVIYYQSCPHLLKNFTRDSWKKCYEIPQPKMIFIHDPYFEKYYPWLRDIPAKHQVKIVCGQQKFFDSIKGMRAMKRIIPNPFKADDVALYDDKKENVVIDHNNYKGVKHKEILVEQANLIEGEIVMFGDQGTLEYKECTKLPFWSKIVDMGWKSREVIKFHIKRAKVVTDFSRFSNVDNNMDYTIIEGIAYGAVPVVLTNICPAHGFEAVKVNIPSQAHAAINAVFKNFADYEGIRKRNQEKLKNLDPEKIARQILEFSNEPFKVDSEGLDRWFQ